jgi:S1/P1 Nuclease
VPAAPARRSSHAARFGALLSVALLLLAPRAAAWNAHGHMLIALLAYDALPEQQRTALVTLLEAHPRYREDLLAAVPDSLQARNERARWLFAYAATWPDMLREQPEYQHGTWHYVNLPLALGRSGLGTCREARRDFPASVVRVAAIDAERRARGEPGIPAGDSILQALPSNQRTLADPNATPRARALALSWVLHLVGDAHQPLHGVALFTGSRFVSGDRGGNDLLVRDRSSLHRVWDELLGEGTSLGELDAGLATLRRDRARFRAASVDARLANVEGWIDEDCDLSRRAVYVPAVLSAVQRFEAAHPRGSAPARPSRSAPGGKPEKPDNPEVSLRDGYFQYGAEKARERALRAGLRLAALLRSIPF